MDEKILNRLEDEILGTIAAGDLEAAKASYTAQYLPLRAEGGGCHRGARARDDPDEAGGAAVSGGLYRLPAPPPGRS